MTVYIGNAKKLVAPVQPVTDEATREALPDADWPPLLDGESHTLTEEKP